MPTSRRLLGILATAPLLVFFLAAPAAAQLPAIVPGFPNVEQVPGTVLSGLNAPNQGRTAIVAYHNGILYTVPELPASQPGSDFEVRSWDISDPANPIVTATYGESPMPIGAHGYLKNGDYLSVGDNWPPEAQWSFRYDSPGVNVRTANPELLCAGTRGCLFAPFFVNPTYWSYGDVGNERVVIARDWGVLGSFDHLGATGVIGHPFLLGDLLIYASDQSRTGVATWDVGDPANPVLLDVLTAGGPGGYWPELWGGGGRLYVVFPYRTGGHGIRVVDVTDPTDLKFIADTPLPGDPAMYVQFQDEYAFTGSHKVDMRTFRSVLDLDGANTVRPNDGGVGIDTSQFALPLGNLLVTGGVGPNQGMAIWAHQAEPDTRGPSVGYHVPRDGRTGYPVGSPISVLIHETLETPTLVNGVSFLVRPVGGSPVSGQITWAFDDILTFTPDAPLAADTTYEVVFPAGGIKDAAGNGMEPYSFTFSTGSSVAGNEAPTVDTFGATPSPAEPGAAVTLTASATDDGGTPELRFDVGDGSPKTAWSASTSVEHVYSAAGHYQATVQARDAAGAVSSRRITVTVASPPPTPRPTKSSAVDCGLSQGDPDAAEPVWAVNPDNDSVARIDPGTLVRDLEVAVCDDPRSVARDGDGDLWVVCHDDDRIRELGADGSLRGEIDAGYGSAPAAVAVSPDGSVAYVTLQGRGELRRYDTATRRQTGALPLGPGPRAIAVSGDGSRVLVTRFRSAEDWAEVWDVDAVDFALSNTIRIHEFGGESHRDGTGSGRGVLNYLAAVALSPDGSHAWVAGNKPNADRGLLVHDDLDQDNTVRNMLVGIDLAAANVVTELDLDNSDSAVDLAFSPLGDYLYVVLQGNDEILVLDALALDGTSGLGSLVTRLQVGDAPQGVCARGEQIWVKNLLGTAASGVSRSLSVFDAAPLYDAGEKTLVATQVATVASESMAAEVLRGKRIFYDASDPRMSPEGYLSCATCHADGGHDGRTWDFTGRGEGLRNTTSLRGRGGLEHGNVHWTANFDEIQDFENDVRGAFGGTGFLDDDEFAATEGPLGAPKAGLDADLDALAAYVSSLGASTLPRSPFRTATGDLTAAAEHGEAHFQRLLCADCHSGESFTDSRPGAVRLHDVGTLRTTSGNRLGQALDGIDTPTLLGAWNTAPYFHDGSAETLDDVFRVAGGTVYPAEEGTPAGGAVLVDQWTELNNDDTVRGRAFVALVQAGASLTLAVDGGSGGVGAVELRHSGHAARVEVRVDGVLRATADLPSSENSPLWRHTYWRRTRIEGVTLPAGAGRSLRVTLVSTEPWVGISLDEVLVSTAGDLAAAEPHRRALSLSAAERGELVRYLLELDGTSAAGGAPATPLFADGFESGSLDAWSSYTN